MIAEDAYNVLRSKWEWLTAWEILTDEQQESFRFDWLREDGVDGIVGDVVRSLTSTTKS